MTPLGYLIIFSYAGFLLWLAVHGVRSRWPSSAQRAMTYGLIPAGLAAVFFVGQLFSGADDQPAEPPGVAGIDPNATRDRLRELSAVLIAADKKGDAKLANAVLLTAVALLVTIEHQPGAKQAGAALYNCALAAKHLSAGAESVTRSGRWLNEDQFQAAAGSCST